MNLAEIKDVAKNLGIKPGKLKKEELVRTIQETEGNFACYNSGRAAVCGQDACSWRDDCDR